MLAMLKTSIKLIWNYAERNTGSSSGNFESSNDWYSEWFSMIQVLSNVEITLWLLKTEKQILKFTGRNDSELHCCVNCYIIQFWEVGSVSP